MQQANSNRMFSLEVRLENNLTRTHPPIENSVCKSSLSVINNGVTFITEMYGVLPIIRRETHFARNKSVCERSDGCCGLHSQIHRLLWAYTDAPRRTRINLDDLRRLVEVICTTLNIRLFLLWLPYFFLDPFITVTGKNMLRSNEFWGFFFELKQKIMKQIYHERLCKHMMMLLRKATRWLMLNSFYSETSTTTYNNTNKNHTSGDCGMWDGVEEIILATFFLGSVIN